MEVGGEAADVEAVSGFVAGAVAAEVGGDDAVVRGERGDVALEDEGAAGEAVDLGEVLARSQTV